MTRLYSLEISCSVCVYQVQEHSYVGVILVNQVSKRKGLSLIKAAAPVGYKLEYTELIPYSVYRSSQSIKEPHHGWEIRFPHV